VLNVADTAVLVAARGRLMQSERTDGVMIAIDACASSFFIPPSD